MKQVKSFKKFNKPVTKVCLSLDTIITEAYENTAAFTSGTPLSVGIGEVLVITTDGVWKGKVEEIEKPM